MLKYVVSSTKSRNESKNKQEIICLVTKKVKPHRDKTQNVFPAAIIHHQDQDVCFVPIYIEIYIVSHLLFSLTLSFNIFIPRRICIGVCVKQYHLNAFECVWYVQFVSARPVNVKDLGCPPSFRRRKVEKLWSFLDYTQTCIQAVRDRQRDAWPTNDMQ